MRSQLDTSPARPTRSRQHLLAVHSITFGYMVAWHILLPLLPVYADSLGATPVQVGLLVSLMTGISFFFCLHLGALADAVGPSRLLRAASVAYAVALIVLMGGRTLSSLVVALGVIGLSNIALVIATETYVAATTSPPDRARAFSTLAVWASAGSLIAPVGGGEIVRRWGYPAAFSVALAVVVGVVALASWTLPRTLGASSGRVGVTATYSRAGTILRDRSIVLILAVNFLAMWAFSLRQSFYPVFLTRIGFSTASLGALMSILGLANMLARPLLPPALHWWGRVRVLGAILGLITVALAITPSLSSFWTIAGAISMLGVAMGLLGPLSTTWITERVPSATWGTAISLRVLALQCAQLTGPSATGLIVAGFGVPAAFHFSAAASASGLIFVAALASLARRAPRVAPAQRR